MVNKETIEGLNDFLEQGQSLMSGLMDFAMSKRDGLTDEEKKVFDAKMEEVTKEYNSAINEIATATSEINEMVSKLNGN